MTQRSTAVAALTAGAATFTLPHLPVWWRSATSGDLVAAVTAGSAITASLLLTWCALVACLALVDARLVRHLAPRGALVLLLGGTATALLMPPASAANELDGLRLPDRPTSTGALPQPARTYEVRPGDTLWHIAAQRVSSDQDTNQIAAATAAWYEQNREVIGTDPDLIIPGQILIAPHQES